jgi:lysophospholipase L1-like esterase
MNIQTTTKRILCYGDSNTWGWVPQSSGLARWPIGSRWTGILQQLLGSDYEVIEEGLGGRTTSFDDPRPDFPERNGLKTLPIILESHLPLDLVIIMLGTTDTKEMMQLSGEQITEGLRQLVSVVKGYKVLTGFSSPQILIVVPPIVDENAAFAATLFKGSSKKGTYLIESYKQMAESEQILYLNPTVDIKVDEQEGVHLSSASHHGRYPFS